MKTHSVHYYRTEDKERFHALFLALCVRLVYSMCTGHTDMQGLRELHND
jgi:hypothetical protein